MFLLITNLFSIFDPAVASGLPLNWVSSMLGLLAMPNMFWLVRSQLFTIFQMLSKFLATEFAAVTGPSYPPGGLLLLVSLFFTIVMNNFFGLFPYIFTASSHLTFTVTLALPLWVGHMVFAWVKSPQNMLAHLVPTGTPYALMPFMVLIELVSTLIRPLTLSVRLAANMVAGHLLLTLLSAQFVTALIPVIPVLFVILTLLGTLELAVALIQAYVFSVLSTLYVNEVNSPALSY